MPTAMKLTLRWEEGSDPSLHSIMKMTLPRKWKEGPISNIKSAFVEHYNSKFPQNQLNPQQVHLLNTKGFAVGDEDIVVQVLQHGDLVRVKPGAAPLKNSVSKPVVKSGEGHVTSKEALEEALEKSTHAFDYSKWDRLDLSDDDGRDVHPNIDKASWVKLMGQQRKERRDKEEARIKKLKGKVERYTNKTAEIQRKIDEGDDDPQLLVDLKDAQDSKSIYEAKLDKFLSSRKLVADDVCKPAESRGLLNKVKEEPPVMKVESPDEELMSYDQYSKANREIMKQYAALTSDEASEEFLLSHPQLLCSHAEGFLLLLTLDTCMKHQLADRAPGVTKSSEKIAQERAKELQVGRQHLIIHYITELAKSMKRDPREAVRPFFRKTNRKSEDKVEGFEEDLVSFVQRIRNRATEKIGKGETSPLVDKDPEPEEVEEEVRYEPAGVGPGGLDPNEVLPTLPQLIQEAFLEQDTDKLRRGFEELSEEEAQYHLKRCIDSGLWVPAEKSENESKEEEAAIPEPLAETS